MRFHIKLIAALALFTAPMAIAAMENETAAAYGATCCAKGECLCKAAETCCAACGDHIAVSQTPGFASIFRTWGFIGDSMSSGEHEYHKADGSKGYADLYEYSWGQFICYATGARGDNYSRGGETAMGWIDHFWDNPKNGNNDIDAKADPKQGYIIALGINDTYRKHPVGNVETDIDLNDYNKNAATYAGSYAGIIQRVQSIQPDAKIFVMTRPKGGNCDDRYNEVVRRMADIFRNVYVIDLYKYGPSFEDGSDFRENYFMGGHLTAAGYQYTAWVLMTHIDRIIRGNLRDFDQVAFIGTDKKYVYSAPR